ncbi:MAG: 3-hydroxyacyl-CoA dehydrogenase NAD-binding domain-containing protein, partial [Rhodospirillales bacterium]
MSDVIEFRKEGDVGVITINNPPANALSFAVVKGIGEIVTSCKEDDSILAVVITGAGRMFVAGADIREFNMTRPVDVPEFHVLIKELEDSPKPIVAAINGIAFGGGLELAMGCHYRLIAPGALVGQPEVKLGIIPGAGGTQRLPRLVGIEIALEMIVEGDPINAERALKIGVVDELVEDNLLGEAISFAKKRVPDGPRPTSGINNRLKNFESKIFDDFRAKITPKSRGLDAPYECINAVEVASNKPFEEGMRFERETFLRLRDGSKSKAMRHMFFAEREVAKIPDISKETIVQAIDGAAVIGSGTMGGGIAMNFANAGIPVFLVDVSQEALDAGLDNVRQNYARSVSSGRFSQDIMDERMALITGTTDYENVAGADIIIEAVFEDMVLKKKIFRELDQICKPEAILASNTSSLDINEIAVSTSRPEKVCGTHFFSPANVMKLMENVRCELSSLETIATVMKLSKTLQKTGVLVGV